MENIHYSDKNEYTRMIGDNKIGLQIELIKQLTNHKILDIRKGTETEDMKNGIDLVITTEKRTFEIGLRTRIWKETYKPEYFDEITLRYDLITKSGRKQKTEFQKIRNGESKIQYFVYSWFSKNGEHIKTTFIDMETFKKDRNLSTHNVINEDGSKGIAIKINDKWVLKIIENKRRKIELNKE